MDDFTLVVPIRDRHYNLKCICSYYKDLDCRKIIIDSSKNQFDNEELIKSSGFEYVYYGPTMYIEKMHKIYHDLVNTEFVLDCSDDDIVLKRSIKECVQFLRYNHHYSACDGQNIWLDKKNRHVFEKHPNKFFGPLKEDFTSPYAKDRVWFEFNCCMTKQHSVIRTEVALKTWDILKNYPPLHPMAFIERFHVFVTAIMGNSKKLPLIFNIRESSYDRVIHRDDIQDEFMLDIEFIDNLDDLHLKPFVELLVENDHELSYSEAFEFIERLIKNQLKGEGDACHINTENWPIRLKWPNETNKHNQDIQEAINAMLI